MRIQLSTQNPSSSVPPFDPSAVRGSSFMSDSLSNQRNGGRSTFYQYVLEPFKRFFYWILSFFCNIKDRREVEKEELQRILETFVDNFQKDKQWWPATFQALSPNIQRQIVDQAESAIGDAELAKSFVAGFGAINTGKDMLMPENEIPKYLRKVIKKLNVHSRNP